MNAVQATAPTRTTERRALVTELPRGRTPAWWGMVLLIVTEVVLFAVLLASYFYVQFTSAGPWPPGGIRVPELLRPLIMTALLVPSSIPLAWGNRAISRGGRGRLVAGLVLTWLLGAAFLVVQGIEYAIKVGEFTWTANAYASLFYSITGLHTVHVVIGWLLIGSLVVAALRGRFTARRFEPVQVTALFWHAVNALWVVMLFALYLSPRL